MKDTPNSYDVALFLDEAKFEKQDRQDVQGNSQGSRLLVGATAVHDVDRLEYVIANAKSYALDDPTLLTFRDKAASRKDSFEKIGFHCTDDSDGLRALFMRSIETESFRSHVYYCNAGSFGLGDIELYSVMYFNMLQAILAHYSNQKILVVFEENPSLNRYFYSITRDAARSAARMINSELEMQIDLRVSKKDQESILSVTDYMLAISNQDAAIRRNESLKRSLGPTPRATTARFGVHLAHVSDFESSVHRGRYDILRDAGWLRPTEDVNPHPVSGATTCNAVTTGPASTPGEVVTTMSPFSGVNRLNVRLLLSESTLEKASAALQGNFGYKVVPFRSRGRKDRLLEIPIDNALKDVQRRISDALQVSLGRPSSDVAGYICGTRPVVAARPHGGAKFIQRIDIHSFFPSVTEEAVRRLFESQGCLPHIAQQLAALTTFEGHLPTGASTSPLVASMILLPIDEKMRQLAAERNLSFSRYADDFFFSSESHFDLKVEAGEILREFGLKLNVAKAQVYKRGQNFRIAGLSVDQVDPGITKKQQNRLRRELFFIDSVCRSQPLAHAVYSPQQFPPGFDDKILRSKGLYDYFYSVSPRSAIRLAARYPAAMAMMRNPSASARRPGQVARLATGLVERPGTTPTLGVTVRIPIGPGKRLRT